MEIINYVHSDFLDKMVVEEFILQGKTYFWNEKELNYCSNEGDCIFYKVVKMIEEEIYKY